VTWHAGGARAHQVAHFSSVLQGLLPLRHHIGILVEFLAPTAIDLAQAAHLAARTLDSAPWPCSSVGAAGPRERAHRFSISAGRHSALASREREMKERVNGSGQG